MELVQRSFVELLTALGTNLLAVVVPVASSLATLLVKARRGWREMREHWVTNVRDVVIATILVWVGLFLWSMAKVVYDDSWELANLKDNNKQLSDSNRTLITRV